jgi:DedD protein
MAEQNTSRKEASKDERRSLLVRAAVAVAIVAVMLIGLSLWDRSRHQEQEETAPTATPPVPASGVHSIGSTSAPKPEPETVESAPVETAQSAPVASESDVVEETRGTETLPSEGKAAQTPREAAPAPHAAASAPAHAEAQKTEPAHPETPPKLVLQTETVPPGDRPPAGKAFALQVGVFSNAANAEDLRAKLVLAGIPAQIETRVQVGPFKSRQEVAAAEAKLKAMGMERGKLVLVKP